MFHQVGNSAPTLQTRQLRIIHPAIAELLEAPVEEHHQRHAGHDESAETGAEDLQDGGADEQGRRLRRHEHDGTVEVVARRLAVAQAAVLGVDEHLVRTPAEAVAHDPDRIMDDGQSLAQTLQKPEPDGYLTGSI